MFLVFTKIWTELSFGFQRDFSAEGRRLCSPITNSILKAMTRLTLVCARFYTTLAISLVEVALSARVADLQQAIFSEMKYKELEKVSAFDLQLFLAKENGEWIAIDDADAQVRRAIVDSSHLTRLYAPRTLSDEKCFGSHPNLGADHIHIVVLLPPGLNAADREAKRLKREHVMTTNLEGLWKYSVLQRSTLPAVRELKDLLLRPLPFYLEKSSRDYDVHNACDSKGLQIECVELESYFNAFILTAENARDSLPTSARAWQTLYDALLQIPIALCAAKGVRFENGRNAAATQEDSRDVYPRPDFALVCDGLVYLRGEERGRGDDEPWNVRRTLTTKMRGWSSIFYGNLPYILGYATAGEDVQVVVIEAHEVRRGWNPATILISFNLFTDTTTALKVFYNLAFVLYVMIENSERLHHWDLTPFQLNVTDKRQITMLDGVVERVVYQPYAQNFERIVAVYKALQSLNSLGSPVTHLQTVERFEIVHSGRLIVQLAPIGVRETPTAETVGAWLNDLLTALKYLHSCGYCHGDVAWRNIVRLPPCSGSSYWVLIDVDEARLPNVSKIEWNHPFKGDRLCFRHDLYQVGQLMADLPFQLSEELVDVKETLLGAVDGDGEVDLGRLLDRLQA